MSEFKFSVGDRVAVRCSVNGYYRGTIKSINRYSWVEHPYVIIKDVNDKYYYTAKESELTRLVKKKKESADDFKIGQMVSGKHLDDVLFTGFIVDKACYKNKHWIRIKNDLTSPWCSSELWFRNHRCTLIENEKPKPKREPLRVGERVVVMGTPQASYFTTARNGDKGIILDVDELISDSDELSIRIHFDDRSIQTLKNIHLKRLIKKPVVFKVGDRVSVFKSKMTFKKYTGVIESISNFIWVKPDGINPDGGRISRYAKPEDCRKLRKRRLRVGDRVSALPRGVTKKVRGVVLQDDKTENPFLILVDKGDYYSEIRIWCKETECKRLARKKKIKSQIPDCKSKYPRDWFEYLKFVTALFGNKNNGDNKDHASASGKRVECQCMQSGCVCGKPIKDDGEDHIAGVGKKVEGGGVCKCSLFVYRSDKPTICIHCNGHLDSSSEKPAKEICNPALWETQQIKNIATSKLINELIRKVERLESTNPHLTCWQCGGIANKPAFYRECVCGAEHK